jgi:hypothetical protein
MVTQASTAVSFARTWFVGAITPCAIGFYILAGIHLLLLFLPRISPGNKEIIAENCIILKIKIYID